MICFSVVYVRFTLRLSILALLAVTFPFMIKLVLGWQIFSGVGWDRYSQSIIWFMFRRYIDDWFQQIHLSVICLHNLLWYISKQITIATYFPPCYNPLTRELISQIPSPQSCEDECVIDCEGCLIYRFARRVVDAVRSSSTPQIWQGFAVPLYCQKWRKRPHAALP